MHVIRRRGWEIPEREATPEHIFLNRRTFLAGSGAAAPLEATRRRASFAGFAAGLVSARTALRTSLAIAV